MQTILFDLDGTVIDSGVGVKRAVKHALEKFSVPIPSDAQLDRFLGPPLTFSFQEYAHLSEEDSMRAVGFYREYYVPYGMMEYRVYDGIPALLEKLCAAGKTLVLATSKPEEYAKKILAHAHLEQAFSFVVGASLDEKTRASKAEVVADSLRLSGAEKKSSVLVGDRLYDVQGARACGIASIGVLYGYGDRQELEEAKATWIAESVSDIYPLCCQ